MAISVISSASATAAPALAGMTSTEGSPAGFADLLFSQLGMAIAGTGPQVASDTKSEKATTKKELATESDALTADPALAFLMSSPTPQTPQPAKADASLAATDTSRSSGTDINIGTGRALTEQVAQSGTAPMLETTTGKQDTPAATALPDGAARASFAEALSQQTSASASKTPTLSDTPPLPTKGNNTSQGAASNSSPALISAQTPAAPGLEKTPDITTPASFLATKENPLPTGKALELSASPANIAAETTAPPPGQEINPLIGNTSPANKAEAAAQTKSEITTPLQSNAWSRDFSDKVVWLAKNDQQQAQININPPQLGPIQITLNISGDQASAVFTSAHPEVRQAIENSLPQLKEMLSAAGINLGQADVGANLAQQNREAPSQSTNGNRLANENAILPGDGNAGDNKISTPLQRGRGLVDLFA